MKRTREHIERQEEELQALGAIYMDDCKDLREKVNYCLSLIFVLVLKQLDLYKTFLGFIV